MYEQVSRVSQDAAAAVEMPQPLSLTQRLNRLRYCCYNLTGAIIVMLTLMLIFIFSRATWMPQGLEPVLYAGMAGLGLAAVVWFIGLVVRRLHDRDHAGWWALLTIVPIINILLMAYLLLAPGSPGGNRFGGPNPPNGVLVQIFGGLWWALSMLSVLMNVVMAVMMPEMFIQSFTQWSDQMEQARSLMDQMPNGGD